jgi:hypothetical protein
MEQVIEFEVMSRVFTALRERPIATATAHSFAEQIDGFVIRHLEKPSGAHADIGPGFPERDSKLLDQVFEIIPDEIVLVGDTRRNVGEVRGLQPLRRGRRAVSSIPGTGHNGVPLRSCARSISETGRV